MPVSPVLKGVTYGNDSKTIHKTDKHLLTTTILGDGEGTALPEEYSRGYRQRVAALTGMQSPVQEPPTTVDEMLLSGDGMEPFNGGPGNMDASGNAAALAPMLLR